MTSRPSQPLRSRRPLSRSVITCLTAVCLLGATAGRVDAASTHPPVLRSQPLAVLLTQHLVHRYPRVGSKVLTSVPPLTPITGESTTLPVIGRSHGARGIHWLKVMLPGRPNGSSGWIAEQNTRASVTGWHLSVDLARRRVTVYRHGAVVRVFRAVVGKPSTPTPTGRFFVQETLQMAPGEPGGPFALALSARSDALQEFEGGPGQIAIHGRDNLGGVLGQAESHGCMRLDTPSIDWLVARIGPGVPVTISQG
jgi:L,D-transpeptidase catalytic domain